MNKIFILLFSICCLNINAQISVNAKVINAETSKIKTLWTKKDSYAGKSFPNNAKFKKPKNKSLKNIAEKAKADILALIESRETAKKNKITQQADSSATKAHILRKKHTWDPRTWWDDE